MASMLAASEILRHLTIPTSRVQFTGVTLGKGAYGKVSEVEYDGKLCAGKEVHSLLVQLASPTEVAKLKDDFLCECHLWSTVRHPNVVSFLGVYYPSSDESGLPVMVMEKMQDSVTSLVEKHNRIPLLVQLSVLHDVSLGLRYLHGHNPPIVHRDLTPNNILVTPHLEAKITDLGVAKTITGNSKTMTKTPGTGVFMPPEALDDKPVYGPPIDVFSLGGVILYITSRQWPDLKAVKQTNPKTGKLTVLSEIQRRQQYIDMMTTKVADLKPLVLSCLEDDPKLRPEITEMSERLNMMKEECSKTTSGDDGMDPFSWLAEIKLSPQFKKQLVLKAEPTVPELFNEPVNIKCREGASLPMARIRHSAVFHNGVVYVGGGVDDKSNPLFTVDIYHPDTDKWDVVHTPHALFAMSVLKGRVVIVGGQTQRMLYFLGGRTTNKILVLENRECKDYATMSVARSCATAVSHQSIMIVIGGYDGKNMVGTTELFDSSTNQYFMIKCDDLKLHSSRSLIVGDTLYVLGGINADGNPSAAVHAASLDTLYSHQLKWQRLVDLPGFDSAVVGLNNKFVLAVGGLNDKDLLVFGLYETDNDDNDDDDDENLNVNDWDDVEDEEGICSNKIFILNSTSTTWNHTATIPLKVARAAVAFDDNSRLVVIGGFSEREGELEYSDKVSIVSLR